MPIGISSSLQTLGLSARAGGAAAFRGTRGSRRPAFGTLSQARGSSGSSRPEGISCDRSHFDPISFLELRSSFRGPLLRNGVPSPPSVQPSNPPRLEEPAGGPPQTRVPDPSTSAPGNFPPVSGRRLLGNLPHFNPRSLLFGSPGRSLRLEIFSSSRRSRRSGASRSPRRSRRRSS